MIILLEYSDKLISQIIEKWKSENPKATDSISKQLIQRFDQIKNNISSKLDILTLPNELKSGNKYLDITQYSFEDMVKLIKSYPENPEKVKKDAVSNFVEKYQIDRATAQSYVARFISKRDDLKFGVQNGIEDRSLSKEDILKFIPKNLLHNNVFLDPRNWKWEDFEHMLDALFPSHKEVVDGEENDATTDSDKVYDKNGIEIYKGDDVHKCISYNPTIDKRKKYGWCITQPGNTNYDYYRFEERQPTFYIVFDRNKTSEPNYSPFKDKWHAFVVQINADGKSYRVTNANNDGDNKADSWEAISKIVPSDTWAKIKDLKNYFKPIALSSSERGRKFASGKNLSADEFKELSQDEKILYVQGKASKNQLTDDILNILPKYKINLEGRSTTLANVAIDSGAEFPYSILKDYEQLAKRYAIFRFRHTDYGKNPIPLPYVKYLDESAKEKYLKLFDDNLTFDYIEKYFGEEQAKKYVNEQSQTLNYLPQNAIKYIDNQKLRQFYTVYDKLFKNWQFSKNTNISDEQLSKMKIMPEQIVNPSPLTYDDWKSLSQSDRKLFFDLAKKSDSDIEKYINASYAVPFFIVKENNIYALLPINNQMEKWVLSDINGKSTKELNVEDFTLGGKELYGGYPNYNAPGAKRVYNFNEMKLKNQKLDEIKVTNPNTLYGPEAEDEEEPLNEYFPEYDYEEDEFDDVENRLMDEPDYRDKNIPLNNKTHYLDDDFISKIAKSARKRLNEIKVQNPNIRVKLSFSPELHSYYFYKKENPSFENIQFFPNEMITALSADITKNYVFIDIRMMNNDVINEMISIFHKLNVPAVTSKFRGSYSIKIPIRNVELNNSQKINEIKIQSPNKKLIYYWSPSDNENFKYDGTIYSDENPWLSEFNSSYDTYLGSFIIKNNNLIWNVDNSDDIESISQVLTRNNISNKIIDDKIEIPLHYTEKFIDNDLNEIKIAAPSSRIKIIRNTSTGGQYTIKDKRFPSGRLIHPHVGDNRENELEWLYNGENHKNRILDAIMKYNIPYTETLRGIVISLEYFVILNTINEIKVYKRF